MTRGDRPVHHRQPARPPRARGDEARAAGLEVSLRGRGRARGSGSERQERDGGAAAVRLEGHRHRRARPGRAGRRLRAAPSASSSPASSERGDERTHPCPAPQHATPARATRARRDGLVIKGIAGSPGVAVGPALVVGDTKAAYARRHIGSAQIEAEVLRLERAVDDAKRHVREVARALARRRPLETNAHPRRVPHDDRRPDADRRVVEHKIREERKCAEWAVAQACDEIGKLFGSGRGSGGCVHRRAAARRRVRLRPPAPRAHRRHQADRPAARPADGRHRARSFARRHRRHGARAGHRVRHRDRLAHQPHGHHGARARRSRPSSARAMRSRSSARATPSSSTACAARSSSTRATSRSRRRAGAARDTWPSRAGCSARATSPA